MDLADDNSDFDSDFNLDLGEHIEASTDKTPVGDTNMTAGQASSRGNPEAIVVNGLPSEEEASVGLFYS